MAILGRIGSGKSTLLKLASGLYEPTGGNILLDNVDIRQISYVIKSLYLINHHVYSLVHCVKI